MSDIPAGVPITYVRDPGVSVQSGGTISVVDTGVPLLVQVTGGTIGTTVSFSGTVTTDIGQIQLKDAEDNLGVMPPAQNAKTGATTAFVVQHLDQSGRPLDAGAIEVNGSIANSRLGSIDLSTYQTLTSAEAQVKTLDTLAGTVATAAQQTAGNALLTLVHNAQGTLATSAAQQTGNTVLTAIFNNQGTQATLAAQQTGNSILTAIFNNQGTQTSDAGVASLINSLNGSVATAPNQVIGNVNGSISNNLLTDIIDLLSGTIPSLSAVLFNAATGTGVSPAVDVSMFNRHTVQHIVSNGTANLQVRTSLDGVHWHVEAVSQGNDLFTMTGHAKYIDANYVNGNGAVVTSLIHCGQPDVGSVVGGANGGLGSNGTITTWGGFSSSLSETLGATYTLDCEGFVGIGLHVVPPTGGQIAFEGSYDGVNFSAITLREVGANGYTQKCVATEDYIGSIACLAKVRFRTSVGGSAPGSIGGRMNQTGSTIEGIEHGNAPHNIGYPVMAKTLAFTGSVYNYPVWIPATGKKWVITDIHFTIDASSVVTIADGYVESRDFLFKGSFKPAAGQSAFVPVVFALPHVAHSSTGSLTFTQTATANVDGVIHGYEIDV